MKPLLLIFLLTPSFAHADRMTISANIIQCGSGEQIIERCQEDTRCCQFIEPSGGDTDTRNVYGDIIETQEVEMPIRTEVYEGR